MKKSLIALAVLAAGVAFADSPAYQVGDKFEAPESDADKLLADGSAKLDDSADAKPKAAIKRTKVRLLIDSPYGDANDVVELDAAQLKEAKTGGIADDDKGAVAYAMTLEQNNPKA